MIFKLKNYSKYHPHIHTVVDCDVLNTIENGYIEYSDGTVYQSVATYSCHIGHNLAMSGDEMRTCGSDGMWNGTAPTCNSEFYVPGCTYKGIYPQSWFPIKHTYANILLTF